MHKNNNNMSVDRIELSSDSGHSDLTATPSEDLDEAELDLLEESHACLSKPKIVPIRSQSTSLSSVFEYKKSIYESNCLAVEVKEAHLSYGSGKRSHQALRGINLRVPKGAIYGLLGPSGCGKTTLLNVAVGLLKLKSGSVKVFGEIPGSRNSIVPGLGVGFMPQDLALYPEFTISETLQYFGRLHSIDSKTLKERADFLIDFLDLPTKPIFVKNLSGGQQRRVSLAAALIHQPPLLILDEPTVGVDPLLRRSIWDYLVGLTLKEGMTVIVTTHYIEEAGQANIVGLMRHGQILAEDNPDVLMSQHKEPSLEKCFLKICQLNKESKTVNVQDLVDSSNTIHRRHSSLRQQNDFIPPVIDATSVYNETCFSLDYKNGSNGNSKKLSLLLDRSNNYKDTAQIEIPVSLNRRKSGLNKTMTLFYKNLTRLRRNLLIAIFQLVLPSTLIILMCLCIGPDPSELSVALVNEEQPIDYSLKFIESINKESIILVPHPDLETALKAVKAGKMWGVVYIGRTFTSSLAKRFEDGLYASNETIDLSSIKVYLDMTNQQIGLTIQKILMESFQNFVRDILAIAGATPLLANLPVLFEEPVYGSAHVSFTEFVAPGVLLNITYFLALSLTVLSSIEERKTGVLNRGWVSGVSPVEVLASHLMTQFLVLIGQVAGLLAFTFVIFDVPARGPFILVIILIVLEGVYGMAFGLFISAIVKEEVAAMYLTVGSFYPCLLLSGMIWPLEGQPYYLRYISICLPQTIPTDALRAVLSRGWGIEYTVVWVAILVILGWTILCLVSSAIIFKVKK